MSVRAGDLAPDIELPADDGSTWSLAALRGRPVVLYFYPKDGTAGCTRQACALRDDWGAVTAAGAVVAGISPDGVERHAAFKAEQELPQTLLSDADTSVLRSYGAWGPKERDGRLVDGVVRTSVVVDPQGRVAAVRSPIDPAEQVGFATAALASLSGRT